MIGAEAKHGGVKHFVKVYSRVTVPRTRETRLAWGTSGVKQPHHLHWHGVRRIGAVFFSCFGICRGCGTVRDGTTHDQGGLNNTLLLLDTVWVAFGSGAVGVVRGIVQLWIPALDHGTTVSYCANSGWWLGRTASHWDHYNCETVGSSRIAVREP